MKPIEPLLAPVCGLGSLDGYVSGPRIPERLGGGHGGPGDPVTGISVGANDPEETPAAGNADPATTDPRRLGAWNRRGLEPVYARPAPRTCTTVAARLRRWWHRRVRGYAYEICHTCGRPVQHVWIVPDELWAELTGHSDGSGILCIPCFDDLPRVSGLGFLYWTAVLERRAA